MRTSLILMHDYRLCDFGSEDRTVYYPKQGAGHYKTESDTAEGSIEEVITIPIPRIQDPVIDNLLGMGGYILLRP